MEIRIAGYVAASHLLETESKPWHALIVLDTGSRSTDFLTTHSQSHLCLQFDDIEKPCEGKRTPTPQHLSQALEFAEGKERLLISCRAGQGRSAALAYVICASHCGYRQALMLLDATRHRPNRLVISIGNDLLIGQGVLAGFDEWRRRHAQIRLSDYYDQMEREMDALEAQGAANRICKP